MTEKSRTIRLPGRLSDAVGTVHATKNRLGRDATVYKLSRESGLSEAQVQEALAVSHPVSLQSPIGEDGATLGDFVIVDNNEDDPVARVETDADSEALRAAIARLPARESTILLFHYGFVDGEPRTFSEIAAELNLTPERVRQIKRVALDRLRDPSSGLIAGDLI